MRSNGSVLWKRNSATEEIANGLWNLREQQLNKRSQTWPRVIQLDTNLIGFWRLNNNGSGGLDLTDSSPNSRTLTNVNGTTLGTGLINGAASFLRSSNQRLGYDSPSFFNVSQSYTVSFWVRCVTIQNYFTLVGTGIAGTFNIHGDSGGGLSWNNSQSGDVFVSGFFTTNVWIHCAFVRSPSAIMTVYKNNAVVYSSAALRTYAVSSYIDIGGLRSNSQFAHNGLMDAVGIWNRALSASEIATLYNSGGGLEL